jgi:hypothetical protein
LDVGCFAPLKRAYGGLIEAKSRCNINHIDKLDFLKAYPQAHTEAFKQLIIQNAFEAAGLVPYNPERVISKLNIQLRTPTPPGSRPGSRSSTWSPKTPANPKQLDRQASSIKSLISRQLQSGGSPILRQFDQVIKATQFSMHGLAMLRQQVYDFSAANEEKKQKRQRSTRRIAQSEGFRDTEAREAFNSLNQANEGQNTHPAEADALASQPIRRAPPRCSDCNQIGHKRTHCPNRSNR